MSHTMKLFERIINHRLRTIVQLGNIHFEFRRKQSTMDPVFVLQFLKETYEEKPHDLHMVFADIFSLQRFDMERHVNDRDSVNV